MALKEYGKETLNANWFEERAEPLAGVLQDNGQREFATTAGNDFQGSQGENCSRRAARQRKLSKGKAMIQLDNFHMCQSNRECGKPESGYGALLPAPDSNQETNVYSTTNESVFGKGKKTTRTQQHRIRAGNVPSSGGHASVRPDKGFAASGATGEVFTTDPDPKRSTVAQRSWMYSADPMIAVKLQEAQNPCSAERDTQVKPTNSTVGYNRVATNITSVAKHKDGIFADD